MTVQNQCLALLAWVLSECRGGPDLAALVVYPPGAADVRDAFGVHRLQVAACRSKIHPDVVPRCGFVG